MTKDLFKVGSSFPATKSITFDNKNGNVELIVHYGNDSQLAEGMPVQIAKYDIGEGKFREDKIEKYAFTMRVSNNIHNVACLDEVEFLQEWTEQEKIPVKASVAKPYSSDENCLHISYEAGKLEDLNVNGVGLVEFGMTVTPQKAPDKIERVEIGFQAGRIEDIEPRIEQIGEIEAEIDVEPRRRVDLQIAARFDGEAKPVEDRKSTRLNSSHRT